jgi:hypothetical protein
MYNRSGILKGAYMKLLSVLLILAIVFVIWVVGSFILKHLRKKIIGRSLLTAADDLGILAVTPEGKFEHNLRMLLRSSPEGAVELLHSAVMRAIFDGKEPKERDVKLLRKLGHLKTTGKEGRALYPDASYEMNEVVAGRVFFCKDLSLAGFKDYSSDVEAILLRAIETKYLSPNDADFLRCLHVGPNEAIKYGNHYGGPGFPYPDERYFIMESIRGELTELCFDEKLNLIVAQKKRPDATTEILWERSGARQPELYR